MRCNLHEFCIVFSSNIAKITVKNTGWPRKLIKIAPGGLSETPFSAKDPFWGRFGDPARSQRAQKWAQGRAWDASDSSSIFAASQKSSQPASGRTPGLPGDLPGTIFGRFFVNCCSPFFQKVLVTFLFIY